MSDVFRQPEHWPRPADVSAAERLIERFEALGSEQHAFAHTPAGDALLRCLGGNSPFLADLAIRDSATLLDIRRLGPRPVTDAALAAVRSLAPTLARPRLAERLRVAKRQIALATAVADIGGIWTVEQVTGTLADLAELALRAAVAHLLRAGYDARELRLPEPDSPEQDCGFVALGMGKLGARELNYSSDIDLILLHQPDSGVYVGGSSGAFYSRFARGLVALMETRDSDGYVFRTDLRLRPDPAATPPCIAFNAAVSYYESMGQNWERAAMLKARPVAGDAALGAEFLAAIRPFVWRRHLDFAAVADIHGIKQRIDAHRKTALARHADAVQRVAGHNIKLGQGGIREIEFLAQTLQLVWGGRDPALRDPRTLEALRLLARSGHLPHRAAGELASAYRFLRRVEHRLQMVADRQTHNLPERLDQVAAFATFMGAADATEFAAVLLRHLGRVQARYAELFEAVPDAGAPDSTARLDFSGVGDVAPETITALAELGFRDHARVVAAVRSWQAGRVRALRSQRARDLMGSTLPAILLALGRQADPDAAFRRFDAFLSRLPTGIQPLSLFQRNPALLERVATVLGAAPSLADHLAGTPSALEGLLVAEEPGLVPRALARRLTDARALEDSIAIIRSTVREEDFRISVATLEQRIDADAAGLVRTDLADTALAELLARVLADFASRNGDVEGGEMVLVALGKAGGREMMAGSDLDLMFVYDHPETVTHSTGARSIAASQWFIRAVHAVVAAITAPDAEGPTYAIDMRLRPSGNKGPVAVSLAAFTRYHKADAWTWERMALTRARIVAGPERLRRAFECARRTALATAGDPARIRADAVDMRRRMLRELPPSGPWDVKPRAGGQIEVEFVAQALQLTAPAATDPTTRRALAALERAGALSATDATLLIQADHVWRTVQGLLRITVGRSPPEKLPEATAELLIEAVGATLRRTSLVDGAALHRQLDELARAVREVFERRLGALERH